MIKIRHDAPRVAVIGGGMAGLECTLEAADRGCRIEIFEVGPRTRTRHVDWDTRSLPGDEKSQSWTCDGWGPGGGLSERLGGRSLCYHGVLLELEPDALAVWEPVWRDRLCGENGLYASILSRLGGGYSGLHSDGCGDAMSALGLRHVPQAARLDEAGRFEAYSPVAAINAMIEAGKVGLTRGRVLAVSSGANGRWAVEMSRDGDRVVCSGFDGCILAASAIGNIQILARSLARDVRTKITDHFCVGAFLRLRAGERLAPFRHPKLWSGFARMPELGSNFFFLERPPLPNGDRLVEIMAVAEQQGGAQAYSDLLVERIGEDSLRTHVTANISERDKVRLDEVRRRTLQWAEAVADGSLAELRPCAAVAAEAHSGMHNGSDARWLGHDAALAAIRTSDSSNVFSRFELPYGAFEHEACTHPIGNAGPIPVSTELEVTELPGVHAVGPGIFPRLGAANPALTILATSHWLGERLAEELSA
jgi:hypothetical protein